MNPTSQTPVLGRTRRLVATALVLPLSLLTLSACNGSSKSASSSSKSSGGSSTTIDIKNFMFTPMSDTVKPGATITVKNEDSTTHTVTGSGSGSFMTGDISGGATKTFTAPTKAGTYQYICSIHNYMKGTIVVS